MIVFIGMETSGKLRRRFQRLGIETYSCDLLPSEDAAEAMTHTHDGRPLGHHFIGDVFETLEYLWSIGKWPTLAVFHPNCTYLTGSAAWAFSDPDFDRYPGAGYHQRVKPGTLVGKARRDARDAALEDVRRIMHLPILFKAIENPVGAIGSNIRRPSQIVQPYEFGDDASKKTCLWFVGKHAEPLPEMRLPLNPNRRVPGRLVNGVERWANQTDQGQNKLSPGDDRWRDRSRTFDGIADAMVEHWSHLVQPPIPLVLIFNRLLTA